MTSEADELFSNVYPLEQSFFGVEVSIRRGNQTTTGVPAIACVTDNQIIDEDTGVASVYRTRDYTIDKSNYKVGGVAVEPRQFDLILEVLGDERAFQVLPVKIPSSSKVLPAYEEEHADGVRWYLRTKEVEE